MKSKAKVIGLGLALLATWLIPFPKKESMTDVDTEPSPPPPEADFRSRIVQIAASQVGEDNRPEYAAGAIGISVEQAKAQGTDKLSWCGLFATWVLQKAGARVNWVLGKGICFNLPRAVYPLPGDIAYIDQPYQHHAIVERVADDGVHTIDGNSQGGKVARNIRPMSAFNGFYDVSGLNPEGIA